jgi:Rab-like protein 2
MNIVLIGSEYVGKSSLISHYKTKCHKRDYHRTIEAETHSLSNSHRFCDLPGSTRHDELFTKYKSYTDSNAVFILMYDITRKSTYMNVASWYKYIKHSKPGSKMILVANKIDTENFILNSSNIHLSKILPHVEVSFKYGTNFIDLMNKICKYLK